MACTDGLLFCFNVLSRGCLLAYSTVKDKIKPAELRIPSSGPSILKLLLIDVSLFTVCWLTIYSPCPNLLPHNWSHWPWRSLTHGAFPPGLPQCISQKHARLSNKARTQTRTVLPRAQEALSRFLRLQSNSSFWRGLCPGRIGIH